MNLNPSLFARFTVRSAPGDAVELACTRCGTPGVLRPRHPLDPAVEMTDVIAWCLGHRCPPQVPVLRWARELVAV